MSSVQAMAPSRRFAMPGRQARQSVVAREQPRSGAFWTVLTAVWAGYYLGILTIGRYEQFTRWVSWVGGGVATLLTLLPMFRNFRRFPAEAWLLFAFLLWSLSGFYLVEDWPNYLRFIQMIAQMTVIVACVGVVLRQTGGANWLYLTFLLGAMFNVIFGLGSFDLQSVGADSTTAMQRDAGLTGNANALGYYCFMGVLGGMALFGEKRSLWIRAAIVAGAAVSLYGLLISASRGPFLVLMVSLVLWGVLCFRSQIRNKALILAAVTMLGALAFLLGRYVLESTYLGKRFSEGVGLEDGSSQMRFLLIRTALQLAVDHPLHGVGLAQFGSASGLGMYTHNEVAELLSTTGVVGFLLYGMIYVVAWRRVSLALRFCRDPLVQYRGNFVRVVIVVLLLSGALFRPNFLSVDTMYLVAVAVGMSEWVVARSVMQSRLRPIQIGETRVGPSIGVAAHVRR